MKEKIVISASRTRDLVRCAPALLAQFISGTRPVRFARSPALRTLEPGQIGALALWTKNPSPLWAHAALRDALSGYRNEYEGAILLNLTVTGLGGTALEPGIPASDSILASTETLIESQLVEPEAIILRYDPLIETQTVNGTMSNMHIQLFTGIARRFSHLGVRRVKVSAVDYRYAHVPRRLARFGIEPVQHNESATIVVIDEMIRVCDEMNMRCDVCCHPPAGVDETTAGCIDGTVINAILEERKAGHRVSVRPHNEIGRQRPDCRCTYSHDIGYSPGIPSCFASAGACLYCYSQRNMSVNHLEQIESEAVLPDRPV